MDVSQPIYGLEDLTPTEHFRSEGVHASFLLDRLCVRHGHYEKRYNKETGKVEPISDINREIGQALEDSIARRVMAKHPGEYLHNPEIECDGIYLTPDLPWLTQQADREIKVTRMSPALGPEDEKMWKYLEQGKAFLYALRRVGEGTARIRECGSREWKQRSKREIEAAPLSRDAWRTLYLQVLFINDFRPIDKQCPMWTIKFWPEELEMSWALLVDEKRLYEKEQEQERDELILAELMEGAE